MKKSLLFLLAAVLVLPAFAQQRKVAGRIPKQGMREIALTRPFPALTKDPVNLFLSEPASGAPFVLAPSETNLGLTRYDLQTNQAVQNRICLFPDGTIGAVWTRGMSENNYPERGTGYNYFDGTAWGPEPTQRIETMRTGWPSYVPVGTGGEMVINHTDYDGLMIVKRDTKGTGAWTQSILGGPPGAVDISWPRMVTSGPGRNNVHVICCTYVPYQGQTQALLYYHSSDGAATWDQSHVILPGTGSAFYKNFGGDCYAFAEPKGDTLAFVVGDNWIDLFMMKSTDGGQTWNKTVIFQHPYPMFEEATTLVTDTPTVSDGSVAIALDPQGQAVVFFGLMRVMNDVIDDGETSYFPGTDGLAMWKEGMPTMTDLRYETLEANNQIVGYTQDLNGNDTILEFLDPIATYYLSVTSMPNVTIDEQGRIFLFMTSIVETLDNDEQNYRHIYARMSDDGGETWTDLMDINGSLVHNFHECVFPNVAAASDNHLHLVYQSDDEPGMSVRGDSDPAGDNTIIYAAIPKTDFGLGLLQPDPQHFTVSPAFPNPTTDATNLFVHLPHPADLSVSLIDLLGREVHRFSKGKCPAGEQVITLDCSALPAGVYIYRVNVNDRTREGKFIIQ